MPITHSVVATEPDDPTAEVKSSGWNADHVLPDVEELPTAETDTTKVLSPDGVGGVAFAPITSPLTGATVDGGTGGSVAFDDAPGGGGGGDAALTAGSEGAAVGGAGTARVTGGDAFDDGSTSQNGGPVVLRGGSGANGGNDGQIQFIGSEMTFNGDELEQVVQRGFDIIDADFDIGSVWVEDLNVGYDAITTVITATRTITLPDTFVHNVNEHVYLWVADTSGSVSPTVKIQIVCAGSDTIVNAAAGPSPATEYDLVVPYGSVLLRSPNQGQWQIVAQGTGIYDAAGAAAAAQAAAATDATTKANAAAAAAEAASDPAGTAAAAVAALVILTQAQILTRGLGS